MFPINRWFRRYFGVSRDEAQGHLILILLTSLLFFAPLAVRFFLPAADFTPSSEDITKVAALKKKKEQLTQQQGNKNYSSKKKASKKSYFNRPSAPFDPNTYTAEDWEALGLFPSIAKRIVKYRKAGGQFRNAEDVGKIYGFPEELLALIKNDLQFPEDKQNSDGQDFNTAHSRKKSPFQRPEAPFDPNTYSAADWEKLGLFPSIAKRIVKYREAGGQFRSAEDVGKIYGFPEELLALIEEDIQIPKTVASEASSANNRPTKYPKKVAVFTEKRPANSVSAEELQQLRGIGAGYSQRIVDYREKIGGFTHAAQLKDVYGLPPEVVERLEKSLSFSGKVKKHLKINAIDIKTLAAHPYFSYSQAKRIVNFRKQHGAFKTLKDLQKIHGLKKDWLEKVKNYLDFSP